MAQYREGSIHLTFGDPAVTGVGTRFLSNVRTGDMLLAGISGPAAFIATVLSDTELLLEQGWPGMDVVGADYAIHRDFDPTTGAPLLAQGDTGLPLVFNRAVGLLSVQTASAVAGQEAVVSAQAARDAATAAASATAIDAAAVAADRGAIIEDKWTVVGVGNAAAADRNAAQAAATAAAGHAGTTAADRTAVATDKAATATALAQAQVLVGQAGTGTATGLVYAGAVKNLGTASDVVAVHVYDTTQDSDGGAWTGRCRDTSWYNETLNTATRGATRRFPRVALIVARTTGLTIYDAHDLDGAGAPRMWMVFSSGATILGGGLVRHVCAVHGRMYIAQSNGLTEICFPGDCGDLSNSAARLRRSATIAHRATTNASLYTIASQAIVSSEGLAAHACVLPGAPLDAAGLPIPTVAVATTGGVSVIHPWGAVYDVTDASGHERVYFIAPDRLMTVFRSNLTLTEVGPIPYADVAANVWRNGFYSGPSVGGLLRFPVDGQVKALAPTAQGSTKGLRFLAENRAHPASGMVAYATTEWATGWQPGDIRGAWLCDTASGNITGPGELVANGAFTGGTTGWAAGADASLAVISTELQVTGSSSYNYAQQVIATVVGQTYVVTATLRKGTSDAARLSVYSGVDVGDRLVTVGTGTVRLTFQAQSSTTYVSLTTGSTSGTAYFSAVSAKLGLPDRSHKANGLIVNGTLSRTALGSGGLAAVSGFSSANYLEQPSNPDLDFGTGDIVLRAWVHLPAGAAGGAVVSRATPAAANPSMFLIVSATILFRIRLDGGNEVNLSVATDIRATGWRCVTAIRSGTSHTLWLDDVLIGTTVATAHSQTNPTAVLRIGNRTDTEAPFSGGSIVAVRVGTTAPTPAQIRKMYADERPLIIGGLPGTLGGTSNNVATLSQDTATGLLHVGTADGISQFDGLARTSYLDAGNSGPALASDNIVSVSAAGGHLVVATNTNVGFISDPLIARDRMAAPVTAPDRRTDVIQARCVTSDATPTDMAPRLYIGEREAVIVDVTVMARTHGASAAHSGSYRRLARYIRDAGGNVTLAGSIQTIGTDQETSAGMDVTLQIDTSAQTITPRVTGVAGTRLVWTARINVTRIAEENDNDQL